jgi:release factor glutamine methyltransferase
MPKEPTQAPRTVAEMVQLARAFLERKGVESARLESELLVAHALGTTRLGLFMQLDRPIDAREIDHARDLLVRRGKREPAAYILGVREFYGRPFKVGPGVLVPRPETEHLVDRARDLARERAARGIPLESAADLGTGSGCIAITLSLELGRLPVLAVDASADALAYARENAKALGAAHVELVEGEGFDVLSRAVRDRGERFDLLMSNPPYIPRSDRASLAPEVRDHEPAQALFAPDDDPDHFVRRLIADRRALVAPGGTILVELGHDQAARARHLAARAGAAVRLHPDYGGHERVLEITVEAE